MPGRDKTGPFGQGPMTGKGAGRCAGIDISRQGAGFGRGAQCGRGFGRGQYWSHPAYGIYDDVTVSEQESVYNEIKALKDKIEELDNTLSGLNKMENGS
jgi:uncharacterized protein DUF5320